MAGVDPDIALIFAPFRPPPPTLPLAVDGRVRISGGVIELSGAERPEWFLRDMLAARFAVWVPNPAHRVAGRHLCLGQVRDRRDRDADRARPAE